MFENSFQLKVANMWRKIRKFKGKKLKDFDPKKFVESLNLSIVIAFSK